MFTHASPTPISLLVGFAGAFLAFSGLESISQLSPVMKSPRKKVIGLALLFVVLTIGITSPLLTMLSTLLQQPEAANPVLSTQLLSLLAGHWGNLILQTEVAISASLILVFASNTAVIGAYHVFMALARMEFFPRFILRRNTFRGTPHWSIALATGIPIVVLICVNGEITILGDMYAFGLLGAFSVTCLGLDVLRWRERRTARVYGTGSQQAFANDHNGQPVLASAESFPANGPVHWQEKSPVPHPDGQKAERERGTAWPSGRGHHGRWQLFDYWLGVLTTFLVISAWLISLISKPLATAFGGSVALLGMVFAAVNYIRGQGYAPVVTAYIKGRLPESLLAVLIASDATNDSVISAAICHARGKPVVFLYLAEPAMKQTPRLFEVVDPYLDDQAARDTLKQAARQAREAGLTARFVYRQQGMGTVAHIWQVVRPRDVVLTARHTEQYAEINPDLIRYEMTSRGKVAHLLKHW
jgi:hypothetical protein